MCFVRTTVFVFSVLLFASACKDERPRPKFRIGFSQCCNDAWRDVMNSEMLRELALNRELAFEMRTADADNAKQIAQIHELVALGVDLLIVAPNESKPLTPIIEEVFKSGIPVILIDRKTESEQYTAYIGGDNYEIGLTAARYIADKTGGKCNILEIRMNMAISPAIERARGFRDGIRTFPDMKILASAEFSQVNDQYEEALARMFEAHPDVQVLFAQTDLMAETAYKIAQKLGRAESIFFVGVDGIPGTGQGIQAVEDGILDVSLLYPTGGAEAIKLAIAILYDLPFDRRNILQTTVITPSNARILHAQMKKEASLQESIDKQIKAVDDLNTIYRNQKSYITLLISSLLVSLVLGAFLLRSWRATQAANRRLEQKTREAQEHEQQVMAISEELKRATQAKVDFFTNISHEFRTPLTLILGFADDLSPSKNLDKNSQQNIGFIRQNAYRLLRLVNQLMDFRKIESDGMRLRASENDLVEFVKNAMRSFSKVAEKRGIDFQLSTRHEQFLVWFDPTMLDKVLFNLLSNAFKFTPDSGKIQLYIHVDTFENVVKIRVEDSGMGMTNDEVEHIFEAFYQGEEGQVGGTGLGLSLSKALVELHSGTLSVSTIRGKGSRFSIVLPLGKAHLRPEQMVAEPTHNFQNEEFLFENLSDDTLETVIATHPNKLDAQQLLIIEDNEDLQFFLKRKLSETYRIASTTDGDMGLQLALETVPDLIICDVLLPNRSGLDIVRTLKSDLRTSHIPVILLTARSTPEQQIEGAAASADSYITKPFNIAFLQETIRNLLHNRQILRESFGKNLHVFSEKASLDLPPDSNQIDQSFLQKFADYIEINHARQDFQVMDLCQEMNLSRSQLYRKVKALTGESITDFVQNARLKKAHALLLEGKMTVAEIGYQVGYSSPDYFSTVFRGKYGVAPSSLRKPTNL